jgi:hypothetical protein
MVFANTLPQPLQVPVFNQCLGAIWFECMIMSDFGGGEWCGSNAYLLLQRTTTTRQESPDLQRYTYINGVLQKRV